MELARDEAAMKCIINPAIKMVGLIVRHREVPSLAKPARAREIPDDSHIVAIISRATH
jgi:hypothetical protein